MSPARLRDPDRLESATGSASRIRAWCTRPR